MGGPAFYKKKYAFRASVVTSMYVPLIENAHFFLKSSDLPSKMLTFQPRSAQITPDQASHNENLHFPYENHTQARPGQISPLHCIESYMHEIPMEMYKICKPCYSFQSSMEPYQSVNQLFVSTSF